MTTTKSGGHGGRPVPGPGHGRVRRRSARHALGGDHGCVQRLDIGVHGGVQRLDMRRPRYRPRRRQHGPATGIDWSPCDPGFECAKVPVPLDWSDPTGEQIELAVIRYPATKPDERIGSMFFNPGGPGDTGVGLVLDSSSELSESGDGRFDIVSWDPRGTHGSSPMHCFDDDAEEAAFWKDVVVPYTDDQSAAFQLKMEDLAQRCGEEMGELLSHISTADTARDLDHLRELSGEDQLTYVGFSYGSMLGQTYANMFPERVRAMMLDGIVDAVEYTASAEAGRRTTRRPPMTSSTRSPSSATKPARAAAPSPAIPVRPPHSAWTSCSRRCARERSPHPTPIRRASSSTAICS